MRHLILGRAQRSVIDTLPCALSHADPPRHSRASIDSFRFICLHERDIPLFVNVAGRYQMDRVLERAKSGPWAEGFKAHGHYDWHAKGA